MYYLRTQAATQAVQFTIEKNKASIPEAVAGNDTVAGVTPQAASASAAPTVNPETGEIIGAVCTMQEGCLTCSA